MVAELRNAGIGLKSILEQEFGNQLKYADKRSSPVCDHRRRR